MSANFVCRGCDGRQADVLLEMGRLPLANAFVPAAGSTEDRLTADLTLVMCRACRLIQLRDLVPRERLFTSYLWVTGTSATAKRHAEWLSRRLWQRHGGPSRRRLVEVASNDGFFLRHYREAGFDILGVDPSDLAAEADAQGVPSIRDFFGAAVAERIAAQRGPADVLVARNVLGHVSELQDLIAGIARLLAPGGTCVIEGPYAYFLREELQYDTIFHEHVSYLTIASLAAALARAGLKITDISCVPMNGGSMLCEVAHADDPRPAGDEGWRAFEAMIRLNEPAGWARFARRVEAQRAAFVRLLRQLAAERRTVVAYGAAAKCMTMLNYCGVDPRLLPAIGDSNPRKQGLLCPGVRIPVVSPQQLMRMRPDYVMIGAWNFKDEIIRTFRSTLGYAGRFIVPLPEPEIVDEDACAASPD
jgi:SAM-dependent methyltransferase